MGQIEAQYKQVDVLPMVKHYMNSLDLYTPVFAEIWHKAIRR